MFLLFSHIRLNNFTCKRRVFLFHVENFNLEEKLSVLSKIKAATVRQNNRLIRGKAGGLFSHRPDLFFWRVTLWLYRTCLLCIQKVRKINQNPHAWLTRFITAKRVKVLAVIRFPPPLQTWDELSLLANCTEETEDLVLCTYTCN